MPTATIRVAVVVLGWLLCVGVLHGALLPIGIVLAVVAAVVPRTRAAWALIGLIAVGEALRGPSAVGAELLLLILGIHVVHVLAAYAMVVPVRGRLQLAALRSPLVSIVLVQLPVQALAVLLLVARGRLEAVPSWSVAGAAALVLVAATFALVVLRRGRRAPGD